DGILQLGVGSERQGVAGLGAADGDDADVAVRLVGQVLVHAGHARASRGAAAPALRSPPLAAVLLHALADRLAPLLQVAVRERVDRLVDADRRLEAGQVDLQLPGVDADVRGDPFAVAGGE